MHIMTCAKKKRLNIYYNREGGVCKPINGPTSTTTYLL